MTDRSQNTVVRLAAAAAVLIAAALICWQCMDIYLAGIAPANFDMNGVRVLPVYSVEIVGEHWRRIAVPVWICAGVMAASIFLVPAGHVGGRSCGVPTENMLRILSARVEAAPEAAVRERKRRKRQIIIGALVSAACLAPAAWYMLRAEHFASWDLESVMMRTMLYAVPSVAAALLVSVIAALLTDRSRRREITALKSAPMRPGGCRPRASRFPLVFARIVIAAAAVCCIVGGALNGGAWDVLVKAVNICTECIGLG